MKNKPFEMCMLYDFYGELLTEKQKELFDLYYNDDLSLAEISEHMGITRQGVRDGIMRAEHALRSTEEKLGLVARYRELSRLARMGLKALEEIPKDASNGDALERARRALENMIQIER